MDRTIYTIYGADAHGMALRLMEAANVAERIPSKQADILLKPNLVVEADPNFGATTHAGVLSGVIEYLQGNGFTSICVGESSWVGGDTQRAFRVAGYDRIGETYGVPLVDLKRDHTCSVDTAIGPMQIYRRALDADYLISLPVLKGHCQTTVTCGLKNSKGCLPDGEKRRFHALGLHKPIAALSAVLKPALTIVDGICGDLNFEEGGTPVRTNRMLLGFDQVQLDAYGCYLMGVDPRNVDYIPLAEAYGAGRMEWNETDVVFLNAPQSEQQAPCRYSGLVARLTRNVQEKSACSACYAALVRALYRMETEYGVTCKLPLAIGQGWKDKAFDGYGIGNCCKRANVSVKGCPPTPQEIMNVLLPDAR